MIMLGVFAGLVVMSALVLTLALLQTPSKVQAAATVGTNVASNQILVNIMDRSLPAARGSSATSQNIARRSNMTAHPVTVTFATINTATRSVTFNVTVPAGYNFVFGFENTVTTATHSYTAAIIDGARDRLASGTFTTSFSLNNQTVAAFNRITTTNDSRFHIYLVPNAVRTINFNTQGGNALASFNTTILHPDSLPRPTHPTLPFIRWSTGPSGPAVTAAQMTNGATLHAVWLHAPTNPGTTATSITFSPVPGATTHQIWWDRLIGEPVLLANASATASSWNLRSATSARDGWTTGNQNFRIVAIIGSGVNMLSSPPAHVTFNETRTHIPAPQNVRIINDTILAWDHIPPVSQSMDYEIFCLTHGWTVFNLRYPRNFISLDELSIVGVDLSNFTVRVRTWSHNYLRSLDTYGPFDIDTITRVTLPQVPMVDDVTLVSRGTAQFLRWKAVPGAYGYSISAKIVTWSDDFNTAEVLKYQDLNGQKVMLDSQGLIVETIDGYHYWNWTIFDSWNWGTSGTDVVFAVSAVGDLVNYANSNAVLSNVYRTQTGGTLAAENIRIEDGLITWDARDFHFWFADNWTGQPIMASLNGSAPQTFWAPFGLENFNNFPGGTGPFHVNIYLAGDGWTFFTGGGSTTLFLVPYLETPEVSLVGNQISWDWDTGAEYYAIYNGNTRIATVSDGIPSFYLNRYELGLGSHEIRVIAVGDGVTFNTSAKSAPVIFGATPEQLDAPGGLMQTNGSIIWSNVLNHPASLGFEVEVIGEGIMAVNANTVLISTLVSHFGLANASFQLRVRALGNEFYPTSNWTSNITFQNIGTLATPSNLSFLDDDLTWGAVPHATGYILTISDGESMSTRNVTTNSFTFTRYDWPVGTYTIMIVATSTSPYWDDSAPSTPITYNISMSTLSAPFVTDNGSGNLSWWEVTGANEYFIYFGGTRIVSLGNVTSVNVDDHIVGYGSFAIQIRAVGRSDFYYDSILSNTITVLRSTTLAEPNVTAFTISQTSDGQLVSVSWYPVANAIGYRVYVGSTLVGTVDGATTFSQIMTNSLAPGSHTTSVIAFADGVIFFQSSAGTRNGTYVHTLFPPSGLSVAGNILSWTAVQFSLAYRVEVIGTAYRIDVTGTSVNLATEFSSIDFFMPGTTHQIRVTVLGDGTNTLNSSEVTYTIENERVQLNAPFITRNGNMLEWEWDETSATHFAIYVGTVRWGELISVNQFALEMYDIADEFGFGSHEFRVRAIGNETHFIPSELSNVQAINVERVTLQTPGGFDIVNGRVEWNPVPNATGFTVEVLGYGTINLNSSTTGIYISDLIVQLDLGFDIFTIRVRAVGNWFYNNSNWATTTFERIFEDAQLDVPTALSISNERILSWTGVVGSEGYRIYVNNALQIDNHITTSVDIDAFWTQFGPGIHSIVIVAIGDGVLTFDSEQSQSINFTVTQTLLPPTGVSISGNTLSWNGVTNAVEYRLMIDTQEIARQTGTEFDLGTLHPTTWGYGNVNIRIYAIGDGIVFLSSATYSEISFYIPRITLTTPTGLLITDNLLTWNTVTYATGFRVYIEGYGDFEVSTNQFDLETTILRPGNHNIRVRALGAYAYLIDSDQSSVVIYNVPNIQLLAPQNVRREGDRIVWNAVTGGVSLHVVLVNGVQVTTVPGAQSYVYISALGLGLGSFPITIIAEPQAQYIVSPPSLPYSLERTSTQLGAPQNVHWEALEGGRITWDAVENALNYRIYLNGEPTLHIVDDVVFDFSLLNIVNAGIYQISVRALSGYVLFTDSNLSANLTYTRTRTLEEPVNLEIGGDSILRWSGVLGATEFMVRVDSGAPVSVGLVREFDLIFLRNQVGSHTIEVMAVGNGTYLLGSAWGAINHNVEPRTLSTPVGLALEDTVLSWTNVYEALEYRIYIDGLPTIHYSPTNSFDLGTIAIASGIFDIQVRAIGNGVYILDSGLSTKIEFHVLLTQLGTPTGLDIVDDEVVWSAISGSYTVYINNGVHTLDVTTNSVLVSSLISTFNLSHAIHTIQVRATGDPEIYAQSALSGAINLVNSTTLEEPTGLDIDSGVLSWNAVPNATSFQVTISANGGNIVLDNITGTSVSIAHLFAKLPIGINTLTLKAIGDGVVFFDSPNADAQFSVTHQLESPNLTIQAQTLTWNVVEHANGYRIYVGENDAMVYVATIMSNETLLVDLTSFDPRDFGMGTRNIGVVAFSGDILRPDSKRVLRQFTIHPIVLATPEITVHYDGDLLFWDYVEGATSYAVYVNGTQRKTVTGTQFDMSTLNLGSGVHEIRLRAIGQGYFADSDWSDYVTFVVENIVENEQSDDFDWMPIIIAVSAAVLGLCILGVTITILVKRTKRRST